MTATVGSGRSSKVEVLAIPAEAHFYSIYSSHEKYRREGAYLTQSSDIRLKDEARKGDGECAWEFLRTTEDMRDRE